MAPRSIGNGQRRSANGEQVTRGRVPPVRNQERAISLDPEGQEAFEGGRARRKGASLAEAVGITKANMNRGVFTIEGTSPYVQHKFSVKVREQLHAKHEAGSVSQKGKKRDQKDFKRNYQEAMYKSEQGWNGLPAPSFRNAMISACRLVGFKMTIAKMTVFIEADGYDHDDGTPMVKFAKGEPHYVEHVVRNDSGVIDLRARPMWNPGWRAQVTIRWDADQFTTTDVVNLLDRAGCQVGIGEGRPDSKNSAGCGWGLFRVVQDEPVLISGKKRLQKDT